MKDGFIKTAAISPEITVADTEKNTAGIKKAIDLAHAEKANILVLPELCVTGYTCGDLFFSDTLLAGALKAAAEIRDYTKDKYPVVIFGVPIKINNKLFNCAVAAANGHILGIMPKTFLPNNNEFYEKRQFTSGSATGGNITVKICGENVPFGTSVIFRHNEKSNYCFSMELCEDLWAAENPAGRLCKNGAVIILNPSASDEVIGKEEYRRTLVSATSARLICGYVYCNAGPGESTQDMVFSAHNIIAENGAILAQSRPFENKDIIITEIDVDKLSEERHKTTSYDACFDDGFTEILFSQEMKDTVLTRQFPLNPFVPADSGELYSRAESILKIQSYGLKKRIEHAHAATAVIGISGGLDSCLALLVTVRAFDLCNKDRKDIIAVTMPCFGTSRRTHDNAVTICKELGVILREINITQAVNTHFSDISHNPELHDVTYENCQARERTQVLMDIANQTSGLVIGTGDLSESALGWATYNGDHMSMYGVNASVPKTLVRYIVKYESLNAPEKLSEVLLDILDTPVSPELLPADSDGNIAQKTEDIVGPYELHDFFLYFMLRFGFSPAKIFRLAKYTFENIYTDETILKWLKIFVRRFFIQQFKRSCTPDSPKVGSVTLSPRGDWRMPSDASYNIWLKELEEI